MIVDGQCRLHRQSPSRGPCPAHWGDFPMRLRSHVSTMRARSAMVTGRYSSTSHCPCSATTSKKRSSLSGKGSTDEVITSVVESVAASSSSSTTRPRSSSAGRRDISEELANDLSSAITGTQMLPRPFSPLPGSNKVVARLSKSHTAASRARSAPSAGLAGVRGNIRSSRDGPVGHYTWITLDFYSDAKKSLYNNHGAAFHPKGSGGR